MAGQVPDIEPLLPLSQKADFINPAWGSQVLMALVVDSSWLGLPAIQLCHALLVLLGIATVGFAVGWRNGSALFAIAAAGSCLYVSWQQTLVVRPQTAGVWFFCALFALLALKLDRIRAVQILIVLGFAVWANLHGSFPLGLFLIGITGIGRAFDFCLVSRRFAKAGWMLIPETMVGRRRVFLSSVLQRSGFYRLLALGICCVVASVLNPYGSTIYEEVIRIGGHPNMSSMIEWRPLSLSMKQGRAAAWLMAALIPAILFTRRRLQCGNMLLLMILGLLTIWSSRMINWWAPIASYLVGIHSASAISRIRWPRLGSTRLSRTSFRQFKAAQALAVGIALALIVTSSSWARGRSTAEILDHGTPVELGEYLKNIVNSAAAADTAEEHLLFSGIVFCPAEWTGYLMSEARKTLPVHGAGWQAEFPLKSMVSTHVHVISPEVWDDFLAIHLGESECIRLLDQYQINAIVLDRSRHGKLWETIRDSGQFAQTFSSKRCMLWIRTHPISGK